MRAWVALASLALVLGATGCAGSGDDGAADLSGALTPSPVAVADDLSPMRASAFPVPVAEEEAGIAPQLVP